MEQLFHPTPYGQYLLLERIGTGGMAEIFRAKTFGAAGFEKEFAIKRILPNLVADEEFVEMFVNEAKLVVDLYHANIVQVFDLGETEGTYYIAMEFVHGKDLLDVLARCTENDLKIPLKLTLYIMMEMLKGLDFAHKAADRYGEPLGIIHRDVSPSNIMLSYAGDVKVGDFGVAKAKTQTHLTEAGTLKGKVGYMSPEQVRGEDIDHRSDVFAAGIILYEALTMSRLFMGGNDLDVMLKIRDSDIEEELARCRKVPPALLRILRKALTKERKDRYQSCEALYAALRDFSYSHDIKSSSRDLSGFLDRVFRSEIETEKARRLEDPALPMAVSDGPLSQVGLRLSDPAISMPGLAHTREPRIIDGTEREQPPMRFPKPGFRYLSHDGVMHGPMTLEELKDLLSHTPKQEGEAVAFGEGKWRGLDELPELWDTQRPVQALKNDFQTPAASRWTGRSSASRVRVDTDEGEAIFTHAGQFGRVTVARLLFRLQRRRCTGMLKISSSSHQKEIYFRRGEPIAVTSTLSEELLGTYLLRRQIISDDELNRALERLSEFGGRLGDALVGEYVLAAHDLFVYLSDQLEDRVLGVFSWGLGDWYWYPDLTPKTPAASLGIDLVELVLNGIRDRLGTEEIRAHFNGRDDQVVEVVHSRTYVEDLPFTPEELELASAVQPNATPTELLERSEASEAAFWRVLYALTEFELYRLGEVVDEPALPG